MKVLSLFDGISCGMVALERAGIPVDAYYASEIDKNATTISQKNYPNIIRLGDVTRWREWDIPWAEINILIGGSPCQGFSFAGKQLNFNDPRSKLFFEFVDILNHIKKHNPNVKFLLENVKMKNEYERVITRYLGVNPKHINSIKFIPQNRPRVYWTNIYFDDIKEKQKHTLQDVISSDCDFEKIADQYKEYQNFYTIPRSKDGKLINGSYNRVWKINKFSGALSVSNIPKIGYVKNGCVFARKLNVQESEMLQTLPLGYTDVVCDASRYKVLGNGWTVDVIAHILKGLL
jgi:DNA (cytosine-5)-methyltransferase 3A